MQQTPTGLRIQIGVFGRANVGKSSLVNWIAGQQISIVSSEPGTTTDVVEKPIELAPLGPVTLLDTGGLDDVSTLAQQRIVQPEFAPGGGVAQHRVRAALARAQALELGQAVRL